MNNPPSQKLFRFFEVVPGAVSWTIIGALVALSMFRPVLAALAIIVFDFYWIIRTTYLTTLLIMAHRKLLKQKNRDWIRFCEKLGAKRDWRSVYHLILFPVYSEDETILRASLQSLVDASYPKEKMVVVVSFEERYRSSAWTAAILEKEFKDSFFGYVTTFHPDGLPGERRLKGANATWAARRGKEFLDARAIDYSRTLVSCFDADTCAAKGYFGCLTYHFLTAHKPHQASYQPVPVYNNNIWHAPSFARLVEMSASFSQMIESMRLEKFVTFSSHSMSFKTLVDIGYWPVDMISDDSVVYWKAYLHYNGDYRVVPLYTTVSMDMAYSSNFFRTVRVQYRQKLRWAWGVENFPYVASRFMSNDGISAWKKIRRSFHLLEGHVTWAVWAIIMVVLAPLPILLGGVLFNQMPIGYNLPRISGLLLNGTLLTSMVWIALSRTILPPRPKDVKAIKNLLLLVEWVIVPFIIIILGSTPALDAQSRMIARRKMEFFVTEKSRPMV